MRPFFKDEGFNFQTEVALGATYHRAADVREVLATVERIRNGHAQSWVDEWSATAGRLAGEATVNAAAGRSLSAAWQFLRVSLYYSLAGYSADGTGDSRCSRGCGNSTGPRGTVSSIWPACRSTGSRSRTKARPCRATSSGPARRASPGAR
jgi:hypothetical protein